MDDQVNTIYDVDNDGTDYSGEMPEQEEPHGCLIAVVIGVALLVPWLVGGFWLNGLIFSIQSSDSMLHVWTGLIYVLTLVVPFLPVVIFLRQERFVIWRGVALSLMLAGIYGLMSGAVLVADQALPYPGLPTWVLPVVSMVFAGIVIVVLHETYLHPPTPGTVLLGFGLSALVAIPWVVNGVLGTAIETWIGLLNGLGTAVAFTVILAAPFTFARRMPLERPFWTMILVGILFWALKAGMLAVRGYFTQGSLLSLGLIPVGFGAGVLLTLGANEDRSQGSWWPVFMYLAVLLSLTFTFTEGFEGDWMPDEMGVAWAGATGLMALMSFVMSLISLGLQRVLQRGHRQLLVADILAGMMALLLVAGYLGLGQPGIQPESYFVVMADQADTDFAAEIDDRGERVTAVYETLTTHAIESQADIQDWLEEQDLEYTSYYLVNGLEVEGGLGLRRQLEARSDVARVLNSPHTRPLPDYAIGEVHDGSEATDAQISNWGVDAMEASRVWSELEITGEGILIGHADSGVAWHHPILINKYDGDEDDHNFTWFDPWEGTTEPTDRGGHGTHTLGSILGGDGDHSVGVAPGAEWIACRNLGRNLGNPAYYLDCMQFLFAPHPMEGDPLTEGEPLRGAHVTNNSWGCPPDEGCDGLTLEIAVHHLRNAGQMFIASNGNEGPGCGTTGVPATADDAFSVGAVNFGGELTNFSSRGPVLVDGSGRIKPDVVAPGVDIYSSWPDGYQTTSGTSMAGPHVTGLVALIWSASPALIGDIDRTEQIIIETATFHRATGLCGGDDGQKNNEYGYGIVNAYRAVQMALELDDDF